MERELEVFVDLDGKAIPLGRLWSRVRSDRESASFEYARSWLARADRFSVDPDLPLATGLFHTDRPLFNAFTDPAPDRWGQTLLRRYERLRARKEGRKQRTLFAIDFLTMVDDSTRLGALRFKDVEAEVFLSARAKQVPPIIELRRLLSATERVLTDQETEDDLQLLLAPGTSLGGARPKALVRDGKGHLSIAKFPRKDDEWPVTLWEATALTLAEKAGLEVPSWKLLSVAKNPVVTLRRFDRRGSARIPFMSALTALGASDNESHSYLEIAEALRQGGAEPRRDLRQLWRRIVFNVLISNTDDHLRNHGLLREVSGWRLAPAYDLNPTPVDVRPRIHALAIDESDATSSLETALSIAGQFGLSVKDARAIAAEVGGAVTQWRRCAKTIGLKKAHIERMASAFEHADSEAVTKLLQ